MKIGIIGCGYVGLVTGVCIATKGFSVICYDSNTEVINKLNSGLAPFFEPELEQYLNEAVSSKSLIGVTDFESMISQVDVVFVAVGTPSDEGRIDLSQISQAIISIAEYIKTTNRFISILIKSTVVPGTTIRLVNDILEKITEKKIGEYGLGMNPEFLREGSAIFDFMNPDRVVIGYEDEKTKLICDIIYSKWDCKKIYCNTATAEMIKYCNNVVLATLISLNNELANLSTMIGGIDYSDVIEGVITDGRWSVKDSNGKITHPTVIEYFKPGIGFGGSCFPKDVEAIRTHGNNLQLPMRILNSVLDVNSEQIEFTVNLLTKNIPNLIEKNVLVLGITFKPNTDDLRQSSSIRMIEKLKNKVKSIGVHDPVGLESFFLNENTNSLIKVKEWEKEITQYDLIIIGTNWEDYLKLILLSNLGLLKSKYIFDSKSFFKEELKNCNYLKIGK
jgi:UDPglucose 6-dehydrogenase